MKQHLLLGIIIGLLVRDCVTPAQAMTSFEQRVVSALEGIERKCE